MAPRAFSEAEIEFHHRKTRCNQAISPTQRQHNPQGKARGCSVSFRELQDTAPPRKQPIQEPFAPECCRPYHRSWNMRPTQSIATSHNLLGTRQDCKGDPETSDKPFHSQGTVRLAPQFASEYPCRMTLNRSPRRDMREHNPTGKGQLYRNQIPRAEGMRAHRKLLM